MSCYQENLMLLSFDLNVWGGEMAEW